MKLNRRQKFTVITGAAIIAAALLIWLGFGGEIFTKTEILVERQDELLGNSYKVWEDKFILGLDYTIGFIGIILGLFAVILWRQRTPKSK